MSASLPRAACSTWCATRFATHTSVVGGAMFASLYGFWIVENQREVAACRHYPCDVSGSYARLASGVLVATLVGIAGPIVGYELSDVFARASQVKVVPTLSASSSGASFGVAAAF